MKVNLELGHLTTSDYVCDVIIFIFTFCTVFIICPPIFERYDGLTAGLIFVLPYFVPTYLHEFMEGSFFGILGWVCFLVALGYVLLNLEAMETWYTSGV